MTLCRLSASSSKTKTRPFPFEFMGLPLRQRARHDGRGTSHGTAPRTGARTVIGGPFPSGMRT